MKRKVLDVKVVILLILMYPVLGVLGWFLGGIYLCLLGLVIANLIDRIWPLWIYDLSWENVDLALENLGKYGATGSHLCFLIKGRKFFIYRDHKGRNGDLYRYALRIPLEHWKDIYSTEEIENIYRQHGGWWVLDECKGLDCLSCFPRNNLLTCKEVLKQFINVVSADLKKDVFARVDSAKKDIWHKYVETEEQKNKRIGQIGKIAQREKEEYQHLKDRYKEEAKKRQAKDKELRHNEREKRIKEKAKQRNK
jgi:hypothetical protein